MGGAIRYIISGGAPLAKEVKDFFMVVYSCPVVEAYGVTEQTGAVCSTCTWDISSGNVGGPLSNVKLKLRDLPELGYLSTDLPNPRGEVCSNGLSVFKGYFRNPSLTADMIDREGWLSLGDVGELLPNGSIKLIDRVKSICKLQQGQYVAPQYLENIYSMSRAVSQVFVSANSKNDSVFAVVVPDKDFLLKTLFEVEGKMTRADSLKTAKQY